MTNQKNQKNWKILLQKAQTFLQSNILKIKGILAIIAVSLVFISYLVYDCIYYMYDKKLNEVFFISTGISIAIFTGLLFTFFTNLWVRVSLVFCSVFYTILEIAYLYYWVRAGKPYTDIEFALFIGISIAITYASYKPLKKMLHACYNHYFTT